MNVVPQKGQQCSQESHTPIGDGLLPISQRQPGKGGHAHGCRPPGQAIQTIGQIDCVDPAHDQERPHRHKANPQLDGAPTKGEPYRPDGSQENHARGQQQRQQPLPGELETGQPANTLHVAEPLEIVIGSQQAKAEHRDRGP